MPHKKLTYSHVVWLLLTVVLINCSSIKETQQIGKMRVQVSNQLLFVILDVNGKKGRFLIDTGARISLVDHNQAKNYGFVYLKGSNSGSVNGIGGRTSFYLAKGIHINQGSSSYDKLKFYASDLSNLNETLEQKGVMILGILGADFFSKTGAIIDYNSYTLSISRNPYRKKDQAADQ